MVSPVKAPVNWPVVTISPVSCPVVVATPPVVNSPYKEADPFAITFPFNWTSFNSPFEINFANSSAVMVLISVWESDDSYVAAKRAF